MKTPKLLIFLFAFVVGFCTITPLKSSAQTGEKIKVIFGTRSHPVSPGDGCDGNKGICIIVKLKGTGIVVDNSGIAEISITGDKMTFNILEDPSPATASENYLNVYADKVLDSEIAEQLGYSSVTIKKGKYLLNKSRNRLGIADLIVETR